MKIELADGLHTKYPEAFSELMDHYADIIISLYGVAQTMSENRELVDHVFVGMAEQASLTCND